jgi:hypothetical protein
LFGKLIFLGFWDRRFGVIAALGSIDTFLSIVTIIPLFPDGIRLFSAHVSAGRLSLVLSPEAGSDARGARYCAELSALGRER